MAQGQDPETAAKKRCDGQKEQLGHQFDCPGDLSGFSLRSLRSKAF